MNIQILEKMIDKNELENQKIINEKFIEEKIKNIGNENRKLATNLFQTLKTLPKSFLTNVHLLNISKEHNLKLMNSKYNSNGFRSSVEFITKDFLTNLLELENNESVEKYDTIFCLNVSKWIHLNYGDVGFEIFFYLVFRMLNSNGIFIFLPHSVGSFVKTLKKRKLNQGDLFRFYHESEFIKKYIMENYNIKLLKEQRLPPKSKNSEEQILLIFQKMD